MGHVSEVAARHQLLITLVHGTWGRGFFPRRQRQSRRPFWFEEGSPFLARISGELSDVPHKIRPLLWSGANSIYVRDKTAQDLAEHLSAEHAEHPQASQLIIAHSHGGNIALRSLHHLQKRDASPLCGAESPNPLVATLATPFIEVHQANFGRRPFWIRVALIFFVIWPLLGVPLFFLVYTPLALLFPLVDYSNLASILLLSMFFVFCFFCLWIIVWWCI